MSAPIRLLLLACCLSACSDSGPSKSQLPPSGATPMAGAGGASPGSGGTTPNAPGSAPAAGTAGNTTPGTGTGQSGSGTAGQSGAGAGAAATGGTPTAGTTAEPTVDAGDVTPPPDAGGNEPPPMTEDCAGDAESDFALVGWATEAGGTTGGRGGTTVNVSNGAQLVQALSDKQDSTMPLTIRVSGTVTASNAGVDKIDVKDVQDVSIIGLGGGAEFDGIGINIVRASNIVVRNLRIHNVTTGTKDGISIEGPADHIWIDHCELFSEYQGVDKDFYDGLIDVKADAQYLTYSWNALHDSWKTMLVGSSEDDTFDRKLTIHHNSFTNCNSRMPLFRGGNGHVFNNLYTDVADTGVNSRIGACLLIEANAFVNSKNPWVSAFSDELGAGELRCNIYDAASTFAYADDVHELPTCTANVPYDYADVLNTPGDVAKVVKDGAGVGKLSDPEQF